MSSPYSVTMDLEQKLSWQNNAPTVDEYSRLIVDNYEFIERQCRRAAARGIPSDSGQNEAANLDNETDELLIEVLDRLKTDNYQVLREFKGKSKLTTYLTTIIANLVIDIVRSRKGRSRAKERAQGMGQTAERLYEMVYNRGLSVADAQVALEVNFGVREPLQHLHDLLVKMRGRDKGHVHVPNGSTWLAPGKKIIDDNGEVEVDVADPTPTAERQLIAGQRFFLARKTLDELLKGLTGEERFMLQLRFPADPDEKSQSIREIANLLGMSEKVVDTRIRRILNRCREMLINQGLALDDLIEG